MLNLSFDINFNLIRGQLINNEVFKEGHQFKTEVLSTFAFIAICSHKVSDSHALKL